MFDDIVIVRGGGDLASGIIHKLHRCGFRVLVLEVPKPTAIRRNICFSESIYEGEVEIEGIRAVHVHCLKEIKECWKNSIIPVIIDPKGEYIKYIKPQIVVDAILAKRNLGTRRSMANITIGIGPGFTAGKDVDLVIETARGHNLGRIIFEGQAKKNTGIPGEIMGYSKERVIHSPCDGIIENIFEVGDIVYKGEIIAYAVDMPVKAEITGVLRGIIRNESCVKKGMKIADIDPRISEISNCCTISDKARNIAGGVLEAILLRRIQINN